MNGTDGNDTRQSEAKGILEALGNRLAAFEIGNEPDLYSYWHRRSSSWSASDYVAEWKAASQIVDGISGGSIPFSGPSFAGTDLGSSGDDLAPLMAFQKQLNDNGEIAEIFGHKCAIFPVLEATRLIPTATWLALPVQGLLCKTPS